MKKEKKKMDPGKNLALSSSSKSSFKSKVEAEALGEEDDEEDGAVDFAVTAADSDTTLIIYMGLGTLPKTKKKLLQDGALDKRTPCLAVENGTTLKERRVFSTLEFIDVAVVDAQLQSPTLLFIGDAVDGSILSSVVEGKFLSSSSSMMRWNCRLVKTKMKIAVSHS